MKSRTFIMLEEDDPVLNDLRKKSQAVKEGLIQRKKFLEQKAKELNEDAKRDHETFWRGYEARLKELGKLPEWYKTAEEAKKDGFDQGDHMEIDAGAIFVHKRAEHVEKMNRIPEPLREIIGHFMKDE